VPITARGADLVSTSYYAFYVNESVWRCAVLCLNTGWILVCHTFVSFPLHVLLQSLAVVTKYGVGLMPCSRQM
jgi:hypothetical protein